MLVHNGNVVTRNGDWICTWSGPYFLVRMIKDVT